MHFSTALSTTTTKMRIIAIVIIIICLKIPTLTIAQSTSNITGNTTSTSTTTTATTAAAIGLDSIFGESAAPKLFASNGTFADWLASSSPSSSIGSEAELTIEQLVFSRSFALETYSVLTADQYILTLHRIVPRRYDPAQYTATRKPVIVQHGLFGAATDFLINAPSHLETDNQTANSTFGFALALTARYDVWLPNTRGNAAESALKHLRHRWSPNNGQSGGIGPEQSDQSAYWSFSFDEFAQYDLPAIIDKVRQITGRETVAYVGYSQGTTSMFALLASKPEYARIIRPFIAWAPVVYMQHIESPFRYLAPVVGALHSAFGDSRAFACSNLRLSSVSHPVCHYAPNTAIATICARALFMFGGTIDARRLNQTRLPVYFHYTPATVSTCQIVHYLQLMRSGRFERFDHASVEENRRKYRADRPPLYDLSAIDTSSITIVLMRSKNDYLSSVPDTDRLIAELRSASALRRSSSDQNEANNENSIIDHMIEDNGWSHLDYTLGIDAGRVVYQPTIHYLDRFA